MNRLPPMALLAALLACTLPAHAADNKVMLPIAAALSDAEIKTRLGEDMHFYFAGQATPAIVEKVGSQKNSLRVNAIGKSTESACNAALLAALLQLKKGAQAVGANAVINIVSNLKESEDASATEFACHSGSIMAGVAFKAEFARVNAAE